jgi:hypothetical protein
LVNSLRLAAKVDVWKETPQRPSAPINLLAIALLYFL